MDVVNLAEEAAKVKRPFELHEVAQLDELGVYVLVSHGRFGWHRHVDEDELFLVLSGLVTMDSEWGSLTLHAGELAVVPKGVGHRSSSMWRSTVLLLRPKLLAGSQNGQRRLFGLPGEEALLKFTLNRVAAQVEADLVSRRLVSVGAYDVVLRRGMGYSEWEQPGRDALALAHFGRILVETAGGARVSVGAGAMGVIPAGVAYRLAAAGDCVMLQVQGH